MKKTIQEITIIIPTRNRQSYLKRILDYYNGFNNAFKIIVSDSSSEENKMADREIIRSFPDLKIFHIDKYEENINPWHKFSDVINYVKTKYCVVCADDDFITPNGMLKSVCFLEKNPDFTIAHGRSFSFYLNSKKRNRKLFCLTGHSPNSVTFPKAQTRLREHLSNYASSTFYSVHRTKFLKMIAKETIRSADDNRFSELLPSMLALIYGKMKFLDILYAVREINAKSTSVTAKTIYDYIKEGNYDEKYGNFKNCLAIHLCKNSNLNIEGSKKTIDEVMSVYLNKNYPNDFKRFVRDKIKSVFSRLNLPESLYEKIKPLYIRTRLNFLEKKNDFQSSINNPSSKYYEDFNRIKGCIMRNI